MSKILLLDEKTVMDKSKKLPFQVNYSRNERVENNEKQQVKDYVERHHEEIGAFINNSVLKLEPEKFLEDKKESKSDKVSFSRSVTRPLQQQSPQHIGALPNKKFENEALLQRLTTAPVKVRKPKDSPASRYFKNPLIDTNREYKIRRKSKKNGRTKYTPRRPMRPNGYVCGRPLPIRAHQQYKGFLNGSEVFRTNSPRSKFLRQLHESVSRKYPELMTSVQSDIKGDIKNLIASHDDDNHSEYSNSSVDCDNEVMNRISVAYQHRFGILQNDKNGQALKQNAGNDKIAASNAMSYVTTVNSTNKKSLRRRKQRRRKKKRNNKLPLHSIKIFVQKPSEGVRDESVISEEMVAYKHCQTRKSITRTSVRRSNLIDVVVGAPGGTQTRGNEENYVVQAMSSAGNNNDSVNNGLKRKIILDPNNILEQDDNFHIFESCLRLNGGTFFGDEAKMPNDLLKLLYNASSHVMLSKNSVLSIGKTGENEIYVICEGHLKVENSEQLLDEHIVIGVETLFKDDVHIPKHRVVSSEIAAIQLKRENFQAVCIAYFKENKILEKFTSSYSFAALLPEYNEKINTLCREEMYSAQTVILNHGKRPGNGYIVVAGIVQLVCRDRSSDAKKGSIVQTYTSGDSFGFHEIFATDKESSKIVGAFVCLNDVSVKKISEENLQKLSFKTVLQKLMHHLSKLELLSRSSLMTQFSVKDLSKFATTTYYQFYKQGKKIIKEGDLGNLMYIIKYGEVSFTKNFVNHNKSTRIDIGHLFKNDFFGEGTVVSKNSTRRATGIANTDTMCLVLPGQDTKKLFGQSLETSLGRIFLERQQADLETDGSTIKASDLLPIKLLGEGSFGKVIYVRNSITGKSYALKQINKTAVRNKHDAKNILAERDILSSLKPHPFICNLIRTFSNDKFVYFLMDGVLGGELFSHMQDVGILDKKDITFYSAQIVVMLDYLHSYDIAFRDLKPENLLITNTGYLKLVDFGLSKVIVGDTKTFTVCGTPTHMAPEVYAGRGHTKMVDWWSFGVLIHEFTFGHVPFVGSTPQGIYLEILSYSASYESFEFPPSVQSNITSIIKRLLNPDPKNRINSSGAKSKSIFSDKFFEKFSWVDLMKSMIRPKYVPKIIDSYDTSNFESSNSKNSSNNTSIEALHFAPILSKDNVVEADLKNKKSGWWKDF